MKFETNIKIVEDQKEENNKVSNISEYEKEMLIQKYYSDNKITLDKKVKVNNNNRMMNKKRINGDKTTSKSNDIYTRTKFVSDEDTNLNLKIEIKSDMKF